MMPIPTPQMNLNSSNNVSVNSFSTGHEVIQSLLGVTKCYDLMGTSNKVVVFESTISFQQAIFALAEHDSNIAPLWEPSSRLFIGLLSISDFIDTLRLCARNGVPPLEVVTKPIRDVLHSAVGNISHYAFHVVDVEDTVYELFRSLQQHNHDFAPILNSDEGSLLAVLGYADIVNLMYQAASRYPELFEESVEQLRSKAATTSYENLEESNAVFAGGVNRRPLSNASVSRSAALGDVLSMMYHKNLAAIPVVDEHNRVIGIYHKEDLNYLVSAQPETVDGMIANILSLPIGEVVKHQLDPNSLVECRLCKCTSRDSIKAVIDLMMNSRATRVVCVDDFGRCSSLITIADIVWYYF